MMITLNLLSEQQRQQIRRHWAADELRSVSVTILFVVGLASVTLYGARHLLSETRDLFTTGLRTTAEATAVAEADSATAQLLTAALAGSTDWRAFLGKISAAVPSGVALDRVEVDASGNVAISGQAATRAALLQLQEQLGASGAVDDLYSPVRNLLQPADISFELTGHLASSTPNQ